MPIHPAALELNLTHRIIEGEKVENKQEGKNERRDKRLGGEGV